MKARFNRALPPALLEHLVPGAWLAPLTAQRQVDTPGGPLSTHLQLREDGRVMLYCGSALLFELTLTPSQATFSATAHRPPREVAEQLLRTWDVDEPGLTAAVDAYLDSVCPPVVKEGRVQALWHATAHPWSTFDHEAAFGYPSIFERTQALDLPSLSDAESAVTAEIDRDPSSWRPLPSRPVRNNRDQLAVDSQGHLVVVELKHEHSSAGLFYGPVQLLRYLHEDAAQLDALLPALGRLLDQKRLLGLAPPSGPDLRLPVRPVLAWGTGMPSAEVQRRITLVLAVANQYLPPNTLPIEVWHQPDGSPERWR